MNLELFAPERCDNVLPYDGIVQDYGVVLSAEHSARYLEYFLQHLAWQADEGLLFGQFYRTQRQVAWYGDEQYQYRQMLPLSALHIILCKVSFLQSLIPF